MPARLLILVVVLAALCFARADATIHDGSLVISVSGPEGRLLDQAIVTLLVEGAPRRVAVSGGRARLSNVAPGEYRVQAESEGHETVIREGIQVTPARETIVEFSLNREPGQTVTLTEEAPLLDPTGGAAGKTFRGEALDGLPRWHTFPALFASVPGVIHLSDGDRETLLFRSRGTASSQTHWFLDSFDVTASDPRLSSAVLSSLRAAGEIRAITGGTDPSLTSSGLHIIAAAPHRAQSTNGSFYLLGSDAGLGGSSSVPRHLRNSFGEADSVDQSVETGGGLSLALMPERMWGWVSFAHRALDGSETREAGEEEEEEFKEESRSLFLRLDSQIAPRYAARIAGFYASREDEGLRAFDGESSGIELHESFVADPHLLLQGSASFIDESVEGISDLEQLRVGGDVTWSLTSLPSHQFEAGINAGSSSGERLELSSQEIDEVSFYAADTVRIGRLTVTAVLRGESFREDLGSVRDFAPRAAVSWRPGEGSSVIRAGYSRYADRFADTRSRKVEEVILGAEREIATGFLLTGHLVARRFEASEGDASYRALELGARRRMSSGIFVDGQVTYADDEDSPGARWAYNLSAIVQIPLAGIGVGASLHGRDGFRGAGSRSLSDSWALDLRASRELGSPWPLVLSIDVLNVTDERVLLVDGGAGLSPEIQRPRAVRLGVSASF